MHATIRRYEGIDQSRTDEVVKNLDENLLPRLTKMPGFSGYYLIEAGNGVMSSVGFFETSEQSDESTRVAATWVRDEKLEKALPNPPKITGGEVIGHKTNGLVRAYVPTAVSEGPHLRAFPSTSTDVPAQRFAEVTAQRGRPRGRPFMAEALTRDQELERTLKEKRAQGYRVESHNDTEAVLSMKGRRRFFNLLRGEEVRYRLSFDEAGHATSRSID